MIYKPNYKSKCCEAEVKIESGAEDFPNSKNKKGQTYHYVCQKCKESCDIQEELNKIHA